MFWVCGAQHQELVQMWTELLCTGDNFQEVDVKSEGI